MGTGLLRRLRVVALVLLVLSVLVSLGTFGILLPPSLVNPIRLDGPSAADTNGKHTAIVDRESSRLLILNKDHELTGYIMCDELNSPIEAITNVCVAGDTIYVSGITYLRDSTIIERECVVAYSPAGVSRQVVFSLEPKEDQLTPSIMTMDNADEDDVYVLYCREGTGNDDDEASRSTVSIVHASKHSNSLVSEDPIDMSNVFGIGYCSRDSVFRTINSRGMLNGVESEQSAHAESSDHTFTSIDLSDTSEPFLYDDTTGTVYHQSKDNQLRPILEEEGYGYIHINGDHLTLSNREMNAVSICDLDGSELTRLESVMPSPASLTFHVLVLVCRCYVFFFFVILGLITLRKRVREGNTKNIGPLFASFVVVLVVSMTIGYISYGAYQALQRTRAEEISTFADYLSYTSLQMSEAMENRSSREEFRTEPFSDADKSYDYLDVIFPVVSIADAATQNGIGTYAIIYAKDSKGIYYLYDSVGEHVVGTGALSSMTQDAVERVFQTNETDDEIHIGRSRYDATQYKLVRIASSDGKSTVGVIEIGSRLRTFESAVMSEITLRIITLLVMVLVVYLTYVELRACAHCFMSFTQMRHHHDAMAILTRPFSFFVTLLSSVDAVMTTLIARALLKSAGMESSGLMLALPSIMLGLGLVLGQATYALLGSRVVIRKLMRRGALFMTFSAICTGAVVLIGNFWLYCLAKLLMAIPFGLLYTLSYSLPRRADTDDVRALAAGGIKRTDTSAAALGTVLGGTVAQQIGNAWVYVVVAIVSLIVFVMASHLLPRTKHPLEKESKRTKTEREALRVLLTSKTTLPIILFIMLPAILAAGYNSFMFPLFSSNLGVETGVINNLFVLGQLVVFASIPLLERLEERFDKWRVSLAAISLLSIVFLVFSFNNTMVWAVVTIALVGVLCKASDGWKALWVRSAKATGVSTGLATGEMFAVRSVLLVVQPLLLGLLLALDSRWPVIVLGSISLFCAVMLHFTTRNSPLAPKEVQD